MALLRNISDGTLEAWQIVGHLANGFWIQTLMTNRNKWHNEEII